WSGPGAYNYNGEDPGGLVSGSYNVQIIDQNGCILNSDFYLEPVTSTIVVTENIVAANCEGNNGSISLTVGGGEAPYEFLWTGSNGFTSTLANITELFEGTYVVSITDANGCFINRSFIVPQIPSNINASTSLTNPNCTVNNGAIDLTVTGGFPPFTYSWTGPGGYIFDGEDPSSLYWGEYFVTITDRYGCSYFFIV